MSEKETRPLLKTKIVKAPSRLDGSSVKYDDEIRFEADSGDQRVIVFDSSLTPEPFMDTNELAALRKRQQMEAQKSRN